MSTRDGSHPAQRPSDHAKPVHTRPKMASCYLSADRDLEEMSWRQSKQPTESHSTSSRQAAELSVAAEVFKWATGVPLTDTELVSQG